jgi:hypothetical protein
MPPAALAMAAFRFISPQAGGTSRSLGTWKDEGVDAPKRSEKSWRKKNLPTQSCY